MASSSSASTKSSTTKSMACVIFETSFEFMFAAAKKENAAKIQTEADTVVAAFFCAMYASGFRSAHSDPSVMYLPQSLSITGNNKLHSRFTRNKHLYQLDAARCSGNQIEFTLNALSSIPKEPGQSKGKELGRIKFFVADANNIFARIAFPLHKFLAEKVQDTDDTDEETDSIILEKADILDSEMLHDDSL